MKNILAKVCLNLKSLPTKPVSISLAADYELHPFLSIGKLASRKTWVMVPSVIVHLWLSAKVL